MNACVCMPESRLVFRHRTLAAILLVMVLLSSSCAGETPATPTLSAEESIVIIVETARAATLTAQPSITPTPTFTSTPSPITSATPTLTPIPPTLTPVVVVPAYRCQDSEFVKDMTIPDGTVLGPGQVFVKTWKFLNNGNCAWRSDYSIMFLRGDRMHGSDAEIGRTVDVDRRLEVSVTMVAPAQPGRYHAHWQLADRYGYPFGEIVTVEIVVANPTPTFTPSPTPVIDRGSLQIIKTLNNPDGASIPASYPVYYNCGVGYIGQVSVAPGGSALVTGIPIGSACSVTEVPPDPISGFTWGTITYSPPSVTILARDQTYTITVGSSINRDRGTLQVIKTLSNLDGAPVPSAFTINYDCGAGYTGQVNVATGSSGSVPGIPVGSTCTVTEADPAAIPGFTWGTVTYNPASIVIGAKDQTFSISVGNAITRDYSFLQIVKSLKNPLAAPVPASFTINYDCGTGYTGSVSVAPGGPATISGIPYGSICIVSEVAPDPIPGFTWETVTYTPTSVLIGTKDQVLTITVNNSITAEDDSDHDSLILFPPFSYYLEVIPE